MARSTPVMDSIASTPERRTPPAEGHQSGPQSASRPSAGQVHDGLSAHFLQEPAVALQRPV